MTKIALKKSLAGGNPFCMHILALMRLLEIAHKDTGQSRHVSRFLLSLYNGDRFPFDLTDFRCLDRAIFNDCLDVLQMDFRPLQEVHEYFINGGVIWEELAKLHGIKSNRVNWRWVGKRR